MSPMVTKEEEQNKEICSISVAWRGVSDFWALIAFHCGRAGPQGPPNTATLTPSSGCRALEAQNIPALRFLPRAQAHRHRRGRASVPTFLASYESTGQGWGWREPSFWMSLQLPPCIPGMVIQSFKRTHGGWPVALGHPGID